MDTTRGGALTGDLLLPGKAGDIPPRKTSTKTWTLVAGNPPRWTHIFGIFKTCHCRTRRRPGQHQMLSGRLTVVCSRRFRLAEDKLQVQDQHAAQRSQRSPRSRDSTPTVASSPPMRHLCSMPGAIQCGDPTNLGRSNMSLTPAHWQSWKDSFKPGH